LKASAIFVLALLGCSAASCAEFCAVRVLVTNEGGAPASALVELRNADGNTVDRSLAPGGEAQFCDFDFGLYSIAVGGTSCGAVLIPNVRLRFGVTQVYTVLLNRCAVWDSIPRGCSVYFRIADKDRRPVGGAVLASRAIGGGTATADSYGRAQIWMSVGTTEAFDVKKEGYSPANFQYTCAKPGYDEKMITMSPLPK
jgi:hypothetical protein